MEIPRYWRMKDYLLRFERRRLHPNPGEIVTESLPRNGKVYSYTVIERESAPAGFEDQAPYVSALVELDNGEKVTTRLTDLDFHFEEKIIDDEKRKVVVFDAEIGMPVEMVTRKGKGLGDREILVYGPSFRPLIPSFPKEVSTSSR